MKYAWAIILFLLSICFGGFGAYENLQKRAIHADEAEQATTFLKLYQDGEYKYNPNGPHGPTLYYWANWALKATSNIQPQEIEITTLRKSMLVVSAIALLSIFILSSEIEQKHWMLLNYKHGAEKTLLNHLFFGMCNGKYVSI